MSEAESDSFEWCDRQDLAPAAPPTVAHVVVENTDAPDELAVFPREGDADELAATWITATGTAFVSLELAR
ncbi:hypothetical protein [Natrinema pallidum]|uniref:DUF7511 domain-containing protein n=1 Tax=Natrinema pallidum TaxID=69527 RepID=A0A4P9TJZ3_9EURY|nr:hypothetical protein [Natrinema pallidum]QCW05296.1 hypothetical protein FGF80_18825 [Natrinema pallidum]